MDGYFFWFTLKSVYFSREGNTFIKILLVYFLMDGLLTDY